MSKFTMELREIVDMSDFDIGLKDYPLYDFKNVDLSKVIPFGYNFRNEKIETFRDYLNNMIINHYYLREIGQDTPERFKLYLNRKMSEIMPFYNQMFESQDITFNPLWNVEMHETFSHTVEDEGEGTLEGTGKIESSSKTSEDLEQSSSGNATNEQNVNNVKSPNLLNDTVLAKMDSAQNGLSVDEIKGHQFLTGAEHQYNQQTGTETETGTETSESTSKNKITNDNEIENESSSNNSINQNTSSKSKRTETYTRLQEGSSAGLPYSDAIKQWRSIMVNIPLQIINDLDDLFFEIFG